MRYFLRIGHNSAWARRHPSLLGNKELLPRPSATVGPRIFTEAGDVYPSVRNFPSLTDAAGHALLALFSPENPFTRRYNPGVPEDDAVIGAGWVSGSCFLARRSALEELGGFDESYFMYNEDMDLCWRAHQEIRFPSQLGGARQHRLELGHGRP